MPPMAQHMPVLLRCRTRRPLKHVRAVFLPQHTTVDTTVPNPWAVCITHFNARLAHPSARPRLPFPQRWWTRR